MEMFNQWKSLFLKNSHAQPRNVLWIVQSRPTGFPLESPPVWLFFWYHDVHSQVNVSHLKIVCNRWRKRAGIEDRSSNQQNGSFWLQWRDYNFRQQQKFWEIWERITFWNPRRHGPIASANELILLLWWKPPVLIFLNLPKSCRKYAAHDAAIETLKCTSWSAPARIRPAFWE